MSRQRDRGIFWKRGATELCFEAKDGGDVHCILFWALGGRLRINIFSFERLLGYGIREGKIELKSRLVFDCLLCWSEEIWQNEECVLSNGNSFAACDIYVGDAVNVCIFEEKIPHHIN